MPHDHTEEGFETTVGINYFGHFLLTHLLMDKLKETAPGSRLVLLHYSILTYCLRKWWNGTKSYLAHRSGGIAHHGFVLCRGVFKVSFLVGERPPYELC